MGTPALTLIRWWVLQVTGVACNVADSEAVKAAFAQLKAAGYRPDVVINNACVPMLHHIELSCRCLTCRR